MRILSLKQCKSFWQKLMGKSGKILAFLAVLGVFVWFLLNYVFGFIFVFDENLSGASSDEIPSEISGYFEFLIAILLAGSVVIWATKRIKKSL
ncbi:hypothetical protein [Campylobacter gastrosuis]|uniref:Uncharacterized protein n=1 Tax=Campylobacter gastrosuis TaxID=2974576 RepID=A0ABT7HPD6_9BACT|nr:hypothetical protein [Campylobacter gastrosuis]MDL0088797.1 hypothetical protein [Campylobacter gastrosuis]